jgi:hypothetical protein
MSVTKVTGMMQTGTKGGDIPSASTLVIDTDGDYFDITGTTGITAMTVDAGRRFTLHFDGALTLTHGSSLYLPGATNFTTEANDCLSFIATAANTVRCTGYALKDGGSPVAPVVADNSITLAKMAGGTDGQVITYDASGDPVAVGPGTDGQVLTSTGAGSPPAFEALPSSGADTSLSNLTTAGENRVCHAWAKFETIGTYSIQDHLNVSSVTDQAPGLFTVNLSITMANANYVILANGGYDTSASSGYTRIISIDINNNGGVTTGLFNITASNHNNTIMDIDGVYVAIFGD